MGTKVFLVRARRAAMWRAVAYSVPEGKWSNEGQRTAQRSTGCACECRVSGVSLGTRSCCDAWVRWSHGMRYDRESVIYAARQDESAGRSRSVCTRTKEKTCGD